MARPPTRVLAFPVPDAPQLSAFPFGSPDTAVLHLSRSLARLTTLGPLLTPQECLRVLSDNALFERLLDELEATARARVERDARRIGLIA